MLKGFQKLLDGALILSINKLRNALAISPVRHGLLSARSVVTTAGQ